jgi:hypothetical protein
MENDEMAKLHELLAAERTPTGAWNAVLDETIKKFKAQEHYFEGHSRSLKMIEDSDANRYIEDQNRDEKPVPTTVKDTLTYAFGMFAKAEDLQCQKNVTNAYAKGTIMWKGFPLIEDLPVDQLLGLEARLTKIRGAFTAIPTLDATKHWDGDEQQGEGVWVTHLPDETTKTEKTVVPVVMAEATKEHREQVQAVTKDVVVGKFSTLRRSGAATSEQKAHMLERIDDLIVEVKRARMRANETLVIEDVEVSKKVVDLLMEPLG